MGKLEESAGGEGAPTPKEDVASIDAAQEQSSAPDLSPPPKQAPPPASVPPAAIFVPVNKVAIVAKVDSVQFPAWIERGGVRAGIKAGWAIYTGDRITTGGEGRVQLSILGEGKMKIAGRADVQLAPNQRSEDPDIAPPLATVRRGTVLVSSLRGDIGGTTLLVGDALQATLAGGEVLLQSTDTEDTLALIDGSVLVSGPKINPGTMTQARSYMRIPRRGRASPVSRATAERVAQWVSPTQPAAGRPAVKAEGLWDVSLNSGYDLKKLETMACRIQDRGIPGEISTIREPGKKPWYRVVVRRFATRDDAVAFLGTAKSLGATQPWVLLPSS